MWPLVPPLFATVATEAHLFVQMADKCVGWSRCVGWNRWVAREETSGGGLALLASDRVPMQQKGASRLLA